jgi:hypothetical protein
MQKQRKPKTMRAVRSALGDRRAARQAMVTARGQLEVILVSKNQRAIDAACSTLNACSELLKARIKRAAHRPATIS